VITWQDRDQRFPDNQSVFEIRVRLAPHKRNECLSWEGCSRLQICPTWRSEYSAGFQSTLPSYGKDRLCRLRNAPADIQKSSAGGREFDPPRAALQKLRADFTFEIAHLLIRRASRCGETSYA
jgi:hypothetical protein